MGSTDDDTMRSVIMFLKKNNFSATIDALIGEAGASNRVQFEKENTLVSYETIKESLNIETNTKNYNDIILKHEQLLTCIDKCNEDIRNELNQLLFPIFVHAYLFFIFSGDVQLALEFFEKFCSYQDQRYYDDMVHLCGIRQPDYLLRSPYIEAIHSDKFTVVLSKTSNRMLKQILEVEKLEFFLDLIQQHIIIDAVANIRTAHTINSLKGSLLGEPKLDPKFTKKFKYNVSEADAFNYYSTYAVLKLMSEANTSKSWDKKKQASLTPSLAKIAFPNRSSEEQIFLTTYVRDLKASIHQSIRVGVAPTKTSICLYTLLNTYGGLVSSKFNLDASLMAVGLDNSTIKVFSITNQYMKVMKEGKDLERIDANTGDIYERILNSDSKQQSCTYVGHSGPIQSLVFDPYNKFFISASQDRTARLWDLNTNSNISAYRGHCKPIWDVDIAPKGYYFATASGDKTARLWTIDRIKCVRIFSGHNSDVSCICYHPNCNYIATGSYDRTVRIWDVVSGNCVRLLPGSNSPVSKLKFSNDGRYLIVFHNSGCLRVYDMASSKILSEFNHFHNTIGTSIYQSHDNAHLYSADVDGVINKYDYHMLTLTPGTNNESKLSSSTDFQQATVHQKPSSTLHVEGVSHPISGHTKYLLESYTTKSTPVVELYYHHKNVLLTVGSYSS